MIFCGLKTDLGWTIKFIEWQSRLGRSVGRPTARWPDHIVMVMEKQWMRLAGL